MNRHINRRGVLAGATGLAVAGTVRVAFGQAAAPGINPYAGGMLRGPSSADVKSIGATAAAPGSSYLLPTAQGWSSTSLLTVGNNIKGYTMVGIPDGLGVFDNGDRTVTLLMNHELGADRGVVRGHGAKGAFVSRWVINKDTLEVVSGQDFVTKAADMHLWDAEKKAWMTGAELQGSPNAAKLTLQRLCSADLAPVSAYFNQATGNGYQGRIFLNGEEGGPGRAMAWVVADNSAWELPGFAFGKAGDTANPPPAWENVLANYGSGDATVVIGTSDGGTNNVTVYIGTKQNQGTPIERAGLTNGKLWSMAVMGTMSEDREKNVGLTKSLAGKGEGKPVALVAPNKGTTFLRPEDGAWDPRDRNRFYFVTTDRNNFAADGTVREGQAVDQTGRARLWALTFTDVTKIATDGTPVAKLELLLDGTEGGDMFDNIAVDPQGRIYLQEDPGNARHNGKIWQYDTASGAFTTITKFDPAKFGDVVNKTYTPPTAPFGDDKETSGIVDATQAFADARWFRQGSQILLGVVQAHFAYDANDPMGVGLVEGGQLYMLARA